MSYFERFFSFGFEDLSSKPLFSGFVFPCLKNQQLCLCRLDTMPCSESQTPYKALWAALKTRSGHHHRLSIRLRWIPVLILSGWVNPLFMELSILVGQELPNSGTYPRTRPPQTSDLMTLLPPWGLFLLTQMEKQSELVNPILWPFEPKWGFISGM